MGKSGPFFIAFIVNAKLDYVFSSSLCVMRYLIDSNFLFTRKTCQSSD